MLVELYCTICNLRFSFYFLPLVMCSWVWVSVCANIILFHISVMGCMCVKCVVANRSVCVLLNMYIHYATNLSNTIHKTDSLRMKTKHLKSCLVYILRHESSHNPKALVCIYPSLQVTLSLRKHIPESHSHAQSSVLMSCSTLQDYNINSLQATLQSHGHTPV